MKSYAVHYELDEAGWWVASVKGVAGCHTQGRSIAQARSRIREALDAALPSTRGGIRLKEHIALPEKARKVLEKRAAAQRRLAEQEGKAQELTRQAIETLVRDLNLSVRDAGALLGLSHQRVQQLVQAAAQ